MPWRFSPSLTHSPDFFEKVHLSLSELERVPLRPLRFVPFRRRIRRSPAQEVERQRVRVGLGALKDKLHFIFGTKYLPELEAHWTRHLIRCCCGRNKKGDRREICARSVDRSGPG